MNFLSGIWVYVRCDTMTVGFESMVTYCIHYTHPILPDWEWNYTRNHGSLAFIELGLCHLCLSVQEILIFKDCVYMKSGSALWTLYKTCTWMYMIFTDKTVQISLPLFIMKSNEVIQDWYLHWVLTFQVMDVMVCSHQFRKWCCHWGFFIDC